MTTHIIGHQDVVLCWWSWTGRGLSTGSQQASSSKKILAESSEKATMVIHQANDKQVISVLLNPIYWISLDSLGIPELCCPRLWVALVWISQALPSWSTPPTSGWSSRCRSRQDQIKIIFLRICLIYWAMTIHVVQIDTHNRNYSINDEVGLQPSFLPQMVKTISRRLAAMICHHFEIFFPGLEQHDQPEERAESTDRVPLQVSP